MFARGISFTTDNYDSSIRSVISLSSRYPGVVGTPISVDNRQEKEDFCDIWRNASKTCHAPE
jgi:hypothetical protein